MAKKSAPPTKESSNKKIYDNLSKTILQFMGGKRYSPMGQAALFKRLEIPPSLLPLCKQILSDLLQSGMLEVSKKQFSLKKIEPDTLTGILRMHPRGFGFVIPDTPTASAQDIFIPKHLTDGAVDGDQVEVLVNPDSNWEKGPEGRIVAILKRGRTHLAGTIHHLNANNQWVAHVPLLGSSKPVIVQKDPDDSLKEGDRIILEVAQWSDSSEEPTLCKLSHYIGHISNAAIDTVAAVEEFDLRGEFPKKVIQEAKAFGSKVLKKEQKDRVDLSQLECITIDPETAKDFDDALSLTKDAKGQYHLGVHIADVAHYVPSHSALDTEAFLRCNSTYFPGSCVPMLPEALSNQLCSLRPLVIRLTVSVLMVFSPEGTLLSYEIVRSFIKSKKRFSYEEAKTVIDGKLKSPHSKMIKLMVELCHLLKKKRSERGSIDFSLPEYVIQVDPKGESLGVKCVEYDISHQLVEEFMLKANEVVAKHLADKQKTPLYRIHEEPAPENREEFFALARSLGFKLSAHPTHIEIQKLFEEAKKTPFAHQLSVAFIRSMKLASYSPENLGHYGLALEYYCHFTSPIRRYSDLIIQRLLFNEEGENLDLEKIALKCSEHERISFKAETSVKVLKKLRLLNRYLKEDPSRVYQGIVTRVKPFGLYFELETLMLEGFLHISELEDDYFLFVSERNLLRGRSSGKIHAVGEKLQLQLLSVDFVLLESKWSLVNTRKRKLENPRKIR